MKVLVVEPLKEPYEKEIEGGLESLQREVGGSIEAVYPYDDLVGIVCNEDGKFTGLELNRALRDDNGEIYDVVAGTFLIVGLDEENFCSLPDEMSAKYAAQFKQPEMFMMVNDKVMAIPVEAEKEQTQPEQRYIPDDAAYLKGALTNLGKYNEGELIFKWISFPISNEDLQTVLKEIGIDGKEYEEYFITDYECEIDGVYDKLGEHTSIRDLNALGERLEEMSSHDLKHFGAVIEAFGASDVAEIINITYNLDCWDFLPDIENDHDLGYYWIEESGAYDTKGMGNLSNYIDYERFGRDVAMEESGEFVDGGYIYANGNSIDRVYDPVHGYEDDPPAHTSNRSRDDGR